MRVRPATLDDADVMGRVMVETWLAAHRGQMSDEAWQKRVGTWTPQVSADGWARVLAEQSQGDHPRVVLLVAVDDSDEVVGLVMGDAADDDPSGSTAQINALYVLPDRQGRGTGRRLLQSAARELSGLGFESLRIGVLAANLPARSFYQAMGGREIDQCMFDEEGELLPETVYGWPDVSSLVGER